MTNKECFKLLGTIKIYYTREFSELNDNDLLSKCKAWHELISHIEIETALIIVKRWASINKWSPTVSDVLDEYNKITGPEIVDEGQAWLLAKKYHYRNYFGPGVKVGEKDNIDIPKEVIEAVRQITHEAIMMSENEDVLRSNFLSIYRLIKNRSNIENRLPAQLKTEKLRSELIENNNITKIESNQNKKSTKNIVDYNKRLLMLEEAKKQIGKSF